MKIFGENHMEKSEIKEIIKRLEKKEIGVFDVPEEYENNIQIVTFERKSGLRITGKQGFDILPVSYQPLRGRGFLLEKYRISLLRQSMTNCFCLILNCRQRRALRSA